MIHQLKNASKGSNNNNKMPRSDKYSTHMQMENNSETIKEHLKEKYSTENSKATKNVAKTATI